MPLRSVPGSASIAETDAVGRLFAPSAARNQEALLAQLVRLAPQSGRALELASGTGQHIIAFAAALPGLQWQPSDVDPSRIASIDAYIDADGTDNILPAAQIDATTAGWAAELDPQDMIVLVNLLHLISDQEAETLIREASSCLAPGGRMVIYGPFRRQGRLTSDGDQRFDAGLRAHDPEIGYKDDRAIWALFERLGLSVMEPIEMPANNLLLVAEISADDAGS
ncbi:DUF938 domain-containing protein [Epibacterium sp. SM1979]|uniref:DUF938 domain-containing protein n=1 Tax=Tritonibacter litoralis TaxID=2662264 RepID=A0A843YII2_9RHOB|nr:DUF938 domain-containing protein [Tritonibacter litoralis]MQQ09033.1 DUF938 domain-containing protein [Tritonibacter litoralis]